MKVSATFIKATPRSSDPLGQRIGVGVKFEGTIEREYERQYERAEPAQYADVALEIAGEAFAETWHALARGFAVNGSYAGDGPLAPDNPAQYFRDRLYAAETELRKATKRAEEAETRLDELRLVLGITPKIEISGEGFRGGINGPSDREV